MSATGSEQAGLYNQHLVIDTAKIRDGDSNEFARLYQKYVRRIYAYAAKTLKNSEDAEEVTQEVFCTVWEQRHKLNSELLLWTLVKRKSIDRLRKRHPNTLAQEQWENIPKQSSQELGIEKQEKQQQWLQKLSQQEQDVLSLALKGISRKEMACKLKLPIGTIDSRLNRIKNKLRKEGE